MADLEKVATEKKRDVAMTTLPAKFISKTSDDLTEGESYFLGMWFIFKAYKINNNATTGNLIHLQYIYRYYPDVVRFVDSDGCNALHAAAYGGHADSCTLLIRWLKKARVELDLKSTIGQHTALHYAAAQGHIAVVKILLKHGMQSDDRDDIGRTG
jgi:ankyrin repeat protein